jgi:6-methylsalicylate decarboxylase
VRIDVHAHLIATDYLDLIDRFGGIEQVGRSIRSMGWHSLDEDLSARREAMVQARVDTQILSISSNAPYFEAEEKAVVAARFANDLYASVVGGGGGAFGAFATLPLPHVEAAIAEVRRALDHLGMLGVTMNSTVLGRPLADESFAPLFAELDRRRAVVFIHSAALGCGSQMIRDAGLITGLGTVVEDTLCALQLLKADFPVRFPRLRVIIAHLGGTLPFLIERLAHRGGRFLPDGPPLRERLRYFSYDTVNGSCGSLHLACQEFGADRLMLGTDYPFLRDDAHAHAVDYIAQSGLSAVDVEAIYAGNAQSMFGISARRSTENTVAAASVPRREGDSHGA